jgi:hypothetical protein
MAYERVHSEATSNARRAREGGRRREREGERGEREREREREGERGREAPLRGLDHPRTIDAREKWSLQRR